jgi:outer membrane protein assembly factor BamB
MWVVRILIIIALMHKRERKCGNIKIADQVNSSPAVKDGYVYVGCHDGKVYCFKAADGDTGSWPMFRYNLARTGAK